MRFFNFCFLLFAFCFFVACEEGVERLVPVADNNDTSADTGDSGDTADTGDSGDTADTGDSGDTADTGDSGDTADTGDSGDTSDTGDTDTGDPGDTDTGDTTDTGIDPDSDQAKCIAENGIWNESAEDELERCYKIVPCADKPPYTEWRGEGSYPEYYSFEDGLWTQFGNNYTPEYGDSGEEKYCQYVCASNARREDNECKPLCSAVFDGNSYIEVPHNEALNLASETWTVEAWIKQTNTEAQQTGSYILRKGASDANPDYLLAGVYYSSNARRYYITSYVQFSYPETQYGMQNIPAGENKIQSDVQVTNTQDWTHVAMVQNKETQQYGPVTTTTYKLLVFMNGKQVASKEYKDKDNKVSVEPTIITNEESLIIGTKLGSNQYFKGKIDSIRISNTAKYTADFQNNMKALEVESDTVAFWDFNGDAKNSVSSALDGIVNGLDYSTDCR